MQVIYHDGQIPHEVTILGFVRENNYTYAVCRKYEKIVSIPIKKLKVVDD